MGIHLRTFIGPGTWVRIFIFAAGFQSEPDKKLRPDLHPALIGDEVKYAFTQALRRATRPTWGSLSEPRREQNLYANPKRTAKSFSILLFSPALSQTYLI